MPARDLTPPPPRTPEEIARNAEITEADLIHAEATAEQLAPAKMKRMLKAKKKPKE